MENLKEFGGRKFSFGNLPPTEAIRVELAVARVIGEPLFKALLGLKDLESKAKKAQMDQGAEVIGTALGLLTSRMDPDELLGIMRITFKYVHCDGTLVNMDSTFANRNREVWEVFLYALRFNFTDFFPESLFNSLKSKAEAKFKGLTLRT